MAVTMDDVRRVLSPDELDYAEAVRLGSEALPYLETLVRERHTQLATKATYLASLIPGERAIPILKEAASSRNADIRVAAAGSARNLPYEEAGKILVSLLADHDIGVRKVALMSVPSPIPTELRPYIARLARSDSALAIRELAQKLLDRSS